MTAYASRSTPSRSWAASRSMPAIAWVQMSSARACRASDIHAAPASNCAVRGSRPSGVRMLAKTKPTSGAFDAQSRLRGFRIESNTGLSGPSVS